LLAALISSLATAVAAPHRAAVGRAVAGTTSATALCLSPASIASRQNSYRFRNSRAPHFSDILDLGIPPSSGFRLRLCSVLKQPTAFSYIMETEMTEQEIGLLCSCVTAMLSSLSTSAVGQLQSEAAPELPLAPGTMSLSPERDEKCSCQ